MTTATGFNKVLKYFKDGLLDEEQAGDALVPADQVVAIAGGLTEKLRATLSAEQIAQVAAEMSKLTASSNP